MNAGEIIMRAERGRLGAYTDNGTPLFGCRFRTLTHAERNKILERHIMDYLEILRLAFPFWHRLSEEEQTMMVVLTHYVGHKDLFSRQVGPVLDQAVKVEGPAALLAAIKESGVLPSDYISELQSLVDEVQSAY